MPTTIELLAMLVNLLLPGECRIRPSLFCERQIVTLTNIKHEADANALCELAQEVGVSADWWFHNANECEVILNW